MKRTISFFGWLMVISLLSLTLTKPVEAGFEGVWTRKTIKGNLKEKAQGSFNRPEILSEIIHNNGRKEALGSVQILSP